MAPVLDMSLPSNRQWKILFLEKVSKSSDRLHVSHQSPTKVSCIGPREPVDLRIVTHLKKEHRCIGISNLQLRTSHSEQLGAIILALMVHAQVTLSRPEKCLKTNAFNKQCSVPTSVSVCKTFNGKVACQLSECRMVAAVKRSPSIRHQTATFAADV